MPGPNAVGGPSRVQQQPTVAPVSEEAPSVESQRDAAIDAVYTRSSSGRRRGPAYASQVKSAFMLAEGSTTVAAAALSNDVIRRMASRSPDELASNFERAGLSPGDASAMAEAIGQRVGQTIRSRVRVRGQELIAEGRVQLTAGRDAVAALRNAPEGTPMAAVYDALVQRFGEERIAQLMQGFDEGLEALDNWSRRLDGRAWTLAELSDAARDVAPVGWLSDGSIASEQIGRGTPVSSTVERVHQGTEVIHGLVEIGTAVVEAGHSLSAAAASGIGAALTAASLVVHHFAHHAHEDFVHGMQRLFEEAR